VEYIERELAALARDLARLATCADDPIMSRRLIEMADEVLALACRDQAESPIYHSAIFFRHTESPQIGTDPHANDRPPRATQRN